MSMENILEKGYEYGIIFFRCTREGQWFKLKSWGLCAWSMKVVIADDYTDLKSQTQYSDNNF